MQTIFLVTTGTNDDGDPWQVRGIYSHPEKASASIIDSDWPGPTFIEEWAVDTGDSKPLSVIQDFTPINKMPLPNTGDS